MDPPLYTSNSYSLTAAATTTIIRRRRRRRRHVAYRIWYLIVSDCGCNTFLVSLLGLLLADRSTKNVAVCGGINGMAAWQSGLECCRSSYLWRERLVSELAVRHDVAASTVTTVQSYFESRSDRSSLWTNSVCSRCCLPPNPSVSLVNIYEDFS